MNRFKPGDKVVVIDGPQAGNKVHTLEARNSAEWCYPLLIDNHCYNSEGKRSWNEPVCLRLATAEEIEAATKPKPLKPLKRGDLVMLGGQIGVVHEIDSDGECWVASLTGDGGCVCRRPDKLIYMGTIRKKIKRLMSQLPEFENE